MKWLHDPLMKVKKQLVGSITHTAMFYDYNSLLLTSSFNNCDVADPLKYDKYSHANTSLTGLRDGSLGVAWEGKIRSL